MKKIISIRITDEEERRIKKLKEHYKIEWPYTVEYTTTDIIRASLITFYNETFKSNK